MSSCNQECNQGRACACKQQEQKPKLDAWDKHALAEYYPLLFALVVAIVMFFIY